MERIKQCLTVDTREIKSDWREEQKGKMSQKKTEVDNVEKYSQTQLSYARMHLCAFLKQKKKIKKWQIETEGKDALVTR